MSPEQNYSLMVRFTRILAWILIGLALACGIGYLAVSTYFYLQNAKVVLWYFVLLGTLFTLTALFAFTMLFAKDKPFVYFTFFFTGVFALVFDLVLLLTLHTLTLTSLKRTLLLVFLLVNILAILSSFVLPIYRLFGQNGPSWAFMLSYFVEMALWISCIAIYGGLNGSDWTFLLLCGLTLLRSSQYEYLGPCEPLSRGK